MQISFAAPTAKSPSGSWVVGALEGAELQPAAIRADKASGGAVSRGLKVSRFTGKPGQILEVLAPSGLAASRILLVGLGKAGALDEKGLETIGAQIVARLQTAGEGSAVFDIEAPKGAKIKNAEIAAHLENDVSSNRPLIERQPAHEGVVADHADASRNPVRVLVDRHHSLSREQ